MALTKKYRRHPDDVMADRVRVWRKTSEFIAHTTIRPKEGEMFVLRLVAVVPHPMPRKYRKRKTT